MTIENSVLNDGAALPASDAGLTGASGDGNDPARADLEQGFTRHDPAPAPGMDYCGLFGLGRVR